MAEQQPREFLQAVLDCPKEDGPRLVFADWLSENGEDERAEFIRVQCEIAKMADAGEGEIDPEYGHTCFEEPCLVCAAVDRLARLKRREDELWLSRADLGLPPQFRGRVVCWPNLGASTSALGASPALFRGEVRRGFVESFASTADDWFTNCRPLMAATPLRKVILTTVPGDREFRADFQGGDTPAFFHRPGRQFKVQRGVWNLSSRPWRENWVAMLEEEFGIEFEIMVMSDHEGAALPRGSIITLTRDDITRDGMLDFLASATRSGRITAAEQEAVYRRLASGTPIITQTSF